MIGSSPAAGAASATGPGTKSRTTARPTRVTATAGTNIALVKYWGKRPGPFNLPATSSLSLTLAEMGTETTVAFSPESADDVVRLNGRDADEKARARALAFVSRVKRMAGLPEALRVVIESHNSVPTAAGLASSASGFAALALAASRAAGLRLSPAALSGLARQGSGSAARSIFGGFARMERGTRDDGEDAVAHPLPAGDGWQVRLVVAVIDAGPKALGSTEAMDRTARTSPYYPAWLASAEADVVEAERALAARDLPWLGRITERSALRMHASAMAAEPAIIYWAPATLAALETVKRLREGSAPCDAYATMDAGPNVKVLCHADVAERVAAALRDTPGVKTTLVASPGPGARVLNEDGGDPLQAPDEGTPGVTGTGTAAP